MIEKSVMTLKSSRFFIYKKINGYIQRYIRINGGSGGIRTHDPQGAS